MQLSHAKVHLDAEQDHLTQTVLGPLFFLVISNECCIYESVLMVTLYFDFFITFHILLFHPELLGKVFLMGFFR